MATRDHHKWKPHQRLAAETEAFNPFQTFRILPNMASSPEAQTPSYMRITNDHPEGMFLSSGIQVRDAAWRNNHTEDSQESSGVEADDAAWDSTDEIPLREIPLRMPVMRCGWGNDKPAMGTLDSKQRVPGTKERHSRRQRHGCQWALTDAAKGRRWGMSNVTISSSEDDYEDKPQNNIVTVRATVHQYHTSTEHTNKRIEIPSSNVKDRDKNGRVVAWGAIASRMKSVHTSNIQDDDGIAALPTLPAPRPSPQHYLERSPAKQQRPSCLRMWISQLANSLPRLHRISCLVRTHSRRRRAARRTAEQRRLCL